jgi:serine/threonine protein kinase
LRPRFEREAAITARLQHPAIVPIYEAGTWPDGKAFYAMRLVEGRTLARAIDAATTLEARIALLPHVVAVTEALAYAHDKRVIHRDLKSGNVLVGAFGETVVIDWGLAKELDRPDVEDEPTAPHHALTRVGSVMGTPCFMAPEQARGEPLDERADVYALGRERCRTGTPTAPRPTRSSRSRARSHRRRWSSWPRRRRRICGRSSTARWHAIQVIAIAPQARWRRSCGASRQVS